MDQGKPWFVIGQYVSVTGDVISHVNISKVAVEDGGVYTCTAVNRIGQTSHSAPLRIYGLPSIRKMDPISAVAGEILIVTCPAAGFPIHSITWEKDGRLLPINLRQTVHPNGTLVVSNVQQRTDQGMYTCQARNRQGHSDKGTVEIAVMESWSDGIVVDLHVPINKGDHLIVIHAGGEIDFILNTSLTWKASSKSGNYDDSMNTNNFIKWALIFFPPEIAPFIFPALAEGSRAQVACNVHRGDLPLNLTWLKDGAPLISMPGVIDIIRFDLYSSILKISSVGRSDSGNYTCVASNPARIVTHTAVLSVSVPPEWVTEPKDMSVIAGHPVTLQCQANGYPVPQHNWRKAKENQSGQFGPILYRNGTFTIAAATEADEGSYLCEAFNGIGASISAVITLSVNALPRFISPVLKERIHSSGTANLHCEAKGDTPMTLVWKRDGAPLPDYSTRYQNKETITENSVSSQLTIKQATASDSGKYVCIATNAFGRDEIAISLYVQDAPEPPWDVHIIECKSREIKVAWSEPTDNNSPILYYSIAYTINTDNWPEFPKYGELNTWVVISDLKPHKTYFIRVIAVNALGPSQPSMTVSAMTESEVPSGPPVDVIISSVGPTSLQLSWSPPHPDERNGPILGYYIGIKQASEGRYNFSTVQTVIPNAHPPPYVFNGLNSYTQYKLALQAFNRVGAGPTSQEITATTEQAAPEEAPQDIECKAVSSISLHLSWLSPPVGTHNGIIKGYKIFYNYLPPPHDLFYIHGIVYHHWVPESQTINQHYYLEVLAL
ncbi:cell adhesion molecule Dscam1-like [Lycorma delicatula]|uniref:cell adhesion molecule Dscam1-like n=1 Tax=Lycorma delicatula TaxID=130591 RepID=UPI003F516C65